MPVDTAESRLARLKLELPAAAAPVANFVPCVQSGTLLFVSGQIPTWNGELRYIGKVGQDVSTEDARAAARLCGLNLIAQAGAFLKSLERITRVCMVQVFVNAVSGFGDHPLVANGVSDLLVEAFGPEAGQHARFAVGAGSLPFNVPVEAAAVFEVR
jgi:enamine deaminase RidA (YjgF/YER057c/UK114 family)